MTNRAAALERIFAHLGRTPEDAGDPLSTLRAATEEYGLGEAGRGLSLCRIDPIVAGPVRGEWVVPPDPAPHRRILYAHGGAWAAGSTASHRALVAELAWRSGLAVLSLDYRLAPEHPFPAALDDMCAALGWVRSNGPDGADTATDVTVAGDSAGGNLAAALALRCLREGRAGPDRLILFSPFLDVSLGREEPLSARVHDPVVQAEAIQMIASLYCPDAGALAEPLVAPLRASDAELAGFPPTLIQASACEALGEQALAFARRLWTMGVTARLSVWPDLPHVWQVFLESLDDAEQAVAEAALFAKAGLADASDSRRYSSVAGGL